MLGEGSKRIRVTSYPTGRPELTKLKHVPPFFRQDSLCPMIILPENGRLSSGPVAPDCCYITAAGNRAYRAFHSIAGIDLTGQTPLRSCRRICLPESRHDGGRNLRLSHHLTGPSGWRGPLHWLGYSGPVQSVRDRSHLSVDKGGPAGS